MEYLFIGFGGTLGAITRFSVSKIVSRYWQRQFPLATFVVNVVGSFTLGLCFVIFNTFAGSTNLESFVSTGFLGALTTYSTFSFEIIALFEKKETRIGLFYLITSVIAGVIAALTGIWLGNTYLP